MYACRYVCRDVGRYVMVCYGILWYGMVRYVMICYDMLCYVGIVCM